MWSTADCCAGALHLLSLSSSSMSGRRLEPGAISFPTSSSQPNRPPHPRPTPIWPTAALELCICCLCPVPLCRGADWNLELFHSLRQVLNRPGRETRGIHAYRDAGRICCRPLQFRLVDEALPCAVDADSLRCCQRGALHGCRDDAGMVRDVLPVSDQHIHVYHVSDHLRAGDQRNGRQDQNCGIDPDHVAAWWRSDYEIDGDSIDSSRRSAGRLRSSAGLLHRSCPVRMVGHNASGRPAGALSCTVQFRVYSATTGLVSEPSPSTVMVTVSPGLSQRLGLRPRPTP